MNKTKRVHRGEKGHQSALHSFSPEKLLYINSGISTFTYQHMHHGINEIKQKQYLPLYDAMGLRTVRERFWQEVFGESNNFQGYYFK